MNSWGGCLWEYWWTAKQSISFCVFKYARAVKQKVWNEADSHALRAYEARAHATLEKKPPVLQSRALVVLYSLPLWLFLSCFWNKRFFAKTKLRYLQSLKILLTKYYIADVNVVVIIEQTCIIERFGSWARTPRLNYFDGKFSKPTFSALGLMHYPPHPADTDTWLGGGTYGQWRVFLAFARWRW